MTRTYTCYCVLILLAAISLSNCSKPKPSEIVWRKAYFSMGAQSSPRAADLNADGVLDLVIGAGNGEVAYTDQGILALDGKTGEQLWQAEADAQVAGSASFYDINADGTDDVIIGGREKVLKALNGKTGETIWSYEYAFADHPVLQYARFNFYNCILVPDQNADGMPELLALNGGNWQIPGGVMEGRLPGVLMVFDLKTGAVLAADTMPDGLESYMSPLCFAQPNTDSHTLIFGTGGETFGGNLYRTTLADLMRNDLSGAQVIAREATQGFVAPPVVADVSEDGYGDIIAISHAGTIRAIDGKDFQLIWEKSFSNTEASGSFAVGYFTHDQVPDVFTIVSKGIFPYYEGAYQLMLDGKSGETVYQDSIGCIAFASPVAYDINRDGQDEVIFSTTEYDCSTGISKTTPTEIEGVSTRLLWLDFKTGNIKGIDKLARFKNVFSTPWIGDIDEDGWLDIVHCQYPVYGNMYEFTGMQIKRIATPIRVDQAPVWGGYMGTAGDGIFIPR